MTRAAQRLYDQESANIGQYAVQHASDGISYVWNQVVTVRVRRRVDTTTYGCTCPFIDQRRVPCRHLIAALKGREQLDRIYA